MQDFQRAAALFTELQSLDAATREARLAQEDEAVRELVRDMLRGDEAQLSALGEGLPGLHGVLGAAMGDTGDGGRGPADAEEADPSFELRGGPYRIDGVLARGGMGVVYRGRDLSIGRLVAIKVLRVSARDRNDARLRFIEEAQVAGQLEHPGIVPIHHLGHDDQGQPFFAMKLVEGKTLARLLSDRRSPRDELPRFLGHVLRVCQTVAYAHARAVIHRDLKPANVMVGAFGEVQVLDWGLAKVLGPDGGNAPESETIAGMETGVPLETARSGSGSGSDSADAGSLEGTVMGTPGYMPPEQALGEISELDRRSDVFALGAILCEVLTGTPPFPGTRNEAWRATRDRQIQPALDRLATCGADPSLIRLASRCLAPEPEDRPSDAGELASSIEGSLVAAEERAEAARLDAERAEARAAAERRARRATLGLSVVAGLLVIAVVSTLFWRAHDRELAVEARSVELSAALDVFVERFAQAREADVEQLEPWRSASVALDAAARAARPGSDGVEARNSLLLRFDAWKAEFVVARAAAESAAERAARDRAILARLESIRAPSGDGVDPFDYPRMRKAYETVFTELGLAIADYEQTAVALSGHRMGAVLGPALDQWALLHQVQSGEAEEQRSRYVSRLLWLASAADPDVSREVIRQAARDDDVDTLRRLARERSEREPESVILLSGLLRVHGERDLAIEALRRSARQHPSDFWLSFHMALALRAVAGDPTRRDRRGLLLESLGYFRAAISARPGSREARHLLGASFEDLGLWRDARAEFEEMIRRDPSDGHARAHLAYCLARIEGWPVALEAARIAAEDAPDDEYVLGRYARALIENGQLWVATELRRRAWELRPSHDNGFRYAQILDRNGFVEESLAMWEVTLEAEPGTQQERVSALYNTATAYTYAGRFDRAEALMSECIELAPDYAQARCNLASILVQQGRFDEGLAAYRACDEMGRRSPGRWPYPSDEWMAKAERGRAFAKLFETVGEEAIAANPPTVERAGFAFALGRFELATRWYDVLIAGRPDVIPRQDVELAACAATQAAKALAADGRTNEAVLVRARLALGWLEMLRSLLMSDFQANPKVECGPVRSWIARWRVLPDLGWLRSVEQLPPELQEEVRTFWRSVDADLAETVRVMERETRND